MSREIRILLIGGGTGGHIYPLAAVADKISEQAPLAKLFYIGEPGPFCGLLEQQNIKILNIVSSKWRRYFSLLNFLDIFKFFLGFLQSLWKIYWLMPDAVFSKGGPGVLPIILVCRFYQIPIIIHESDAVPGLTNKMSGRYAQKIFLAFAEAQNYFGKVDLEVTGQPTRAEILRELPSDEAKKTLGFSPDAPLILFMGGSQGSARLNDFVLNNLGMFLEKFQILHQVGENNYADYLKDYGIENQRLTSAAKNRYQFAAYLDINQPLTLFNALSAADIIVSRGGAGAIFEIAAYGKPAILIPLPESANGHQKANTYAYQKSGAAVIVEEENLLPNLLENIIESLLKNPEQMRTMSAAAKQFYKPDAAEKIAKGILTIVG